MTWHKCNLKFRQQVSEKLKPSLYIHRKKSIIQAWILVQLDVVKSISTNLQKLQKHEEVKQA